MRLGRWCAMATVTTEEPTPPEPSSLRKPDLLWVLRLILVAAALALLWLAQRRFETWQARYASEFKSSIDLWLEWVGLAVSSGLAFASAAWLPGGRLSYRWGRALLLGVLPLLGLVHFALFLQFRQDLPSFLGDHVWFYMSLGPQFALAVMLGVAIAAGFAPSERPSGATSLAA
jgi:hypothetical protein